jgi:lipopolysaccharide transport system ATP-binding protein
VATSAIRVDGLSKCYQLGRHTGYQTLRDGIARVATAPLRRLSGAEAPPHGRDTIWALRDVSFEVPQGQVVGILGGNGAGKSTLLKVLSRITEPSAGRAELRGRVASLLEVGTGFHPELTGRENVYLNGAILGMKKREVDGQYDEIVEFSGVERFLETPVKRYSSGMKMRLAFAVAAHLQSEIVIVDEVLAVGDAEFQRKCLGKMNAIAGEGRTVLFVSHNTALLSSLCDRGLVLVAGELRLDAAIADAVSEHLRTFENAANTNLLERTDRAGEGELRLAAVEVHGEGNGHDGPPSPGGPARFVFHVPEAPGPWDLRFMIYDQQGFPVASLDSRVAENAELEADRDGDVLICDVAELPLVPGRYRVNTALFHRGCLQDHLEGAAVFEVTEGQFEGRAVEAKRGTGAVLLRYRFREGVPGAAS